LTLLPETNCDVFLLKVFENKNLNPILNRVEKK